MKAEATKRAITMATRVASNDDGAGDSGKSNGDGDEGAGRATMRAMVAATTVAAMRVPSDKEGEGGKVMETVFVCVCVFLASGYRLVTVMHEIPISSAHLLTSLPYPRTR